MQELEKILEEMREASVFAKNYDGSVAECVTIVAAERILRKHTKNDGWIPVEERLPENGHSVLICGIHGWIDVGWYIRGTWSTGFSAAEIVKEVVAWMPLPEPYKPKRREKS